MKLTRRDAIAVLAGAGILGGAGAAALARDGFSDDTGGNGDAAGGGPGGSSSDADGDGAVDGEVTPSETASAPPDADVETLVAALVGTARAVYPSEVENVRAFVETYASTKLERRGEFREGASEALSDLDAEAAITFDAAYADLDAAEAETVLRRVGAETAEPDPDGTAAERVRYYVVNEVLYALYTSPTGGELVGIENPQGHPGGTDSYQRGPSR